MTDTKKLIKGSLKIGVYPILLGIVIGTISVFLPTEHTIGLIGLFGSFSLLFIILRRSVPNDIFIIIMAAFIIRASLALINVYVSPLPDSQADAASFERWGWIWAQNLKEGVPVNLHINKLYPYIIAVIYFFTGRSPLLIHSLNVLLGTLIVYNVYRIGCKIFDHNAARIAAVITCFYPTLILYSAITLREVEVVYPLTLFMWWFVNWFEKNKTSDLIKSVIAIMVSGIFHAAMLSLLVVPLGVALWRIIRSFLKIKMVTLTKLFITSITCLGAVIFLNKNMGNPYGHTLDFIHVFRSNAARGRTAYLSGLELTSFVDLFKYMPSMVVNFLYGPFFWNAYTSKDILGVLDGLLLLSLTIFSIAGLKKISRDKNFGHVAVLVGVLGVGILVFSLGTSNYGTAVRHRAKFVWLLAILAGGFFQKKKQKTKNTTKA